MTLDKVAKKIRDLISKSAKAKIEIGKLLNAHTKDIEHGRKEEFYKSIGMSDRTAQYYMKIARKIDEMEAEGNKIDLEGLNMSRILEMVGMRVNIRGANNENAPQQQEYTPKGYGSFNFNKCRSTRIFKAEYKALTDKVSELEEELESLKPKTA